MHGSVADPAAVDPDSNLEDRKPQNRNWISRNNQDPDPTCQNSPITFVLININIKMLALYILTLVNKWGKLNSNKIMDSGPTFFQITDLDQTKRP